MNDDMHRAAVQATIKHLQRSSTEEQAFLTEVTVRLDAQIGRTRRHRARLAVHRALLDELESRTRPDAP